MIGRAVLLAAVVALAACGGEPAVIDGSTPETFRATTEAARRDLGVKDRLAFDAALRKVPGSRFGTDAAEMEVLARSAYNGMTAEDVVELAGR
jgi:hypothetical protein